MKVLNNRYLIEDKHSADSTGEIYYAKDLAMDSRKMYLKLYAVDFSTEKTMDSLVEDLERIKSVRHPNLTEVYDFDIVTHVDGKQVNGLQYHYTYEWFNEETQVSYLSLSRDEMRSAITQILSCLRYLHYRGFCYRYLNFHNILFLRSPEGLRIKLKNLVYMNFYSETYTLSSGAHNVFMAPEVIWENTAYPSSDIYSFGVLLYYLYFGIDYREKHFSDLYASPSENDIHSLIRKMTNTYSGDRPASIEEVAMEVISTLRLRFDRNDYESYNRIYPHTNLVGRHKDIATITAMVQQKLKTKSGGNGALIIGEKGMGKTRMLSEIQFRLRLEGYSIMRFDAKHDKDFNLFSDVIRRIFMTERVGFDLVQQYGSELVKLIPEIVDRWKVHPGEILQRDKENLKIANRAYNFIADFTENEPLILLIDNLERINGYDLVVLDYLMRRELKSPLFIIATGVEDVASDRYVQNWLESEHSTRFMMNGFTYEDANTFLSLVFGIVNKPLSFTTHLMKNIGGNPGRMLETIGALYQKGVLKVTEKLTWNFDEVMLENPVEHSIERVQAEFDVDELSSMQRGLLAVAAIFEEAVSCETLSAFMDIDHKATFDLLKELVQRDIIEEKFNDYGYTYNFTNRKVKERLSELIDPDQLVEYHRKAAEIFEDEIRTNKKKYSEPLIHHLFHSKQYSKAAQFCIFAAEQMRSFNIDSQVLSFYQKAAEIFTEMSQYTRVSEVLIVMGDIYRKNGRYDEALQAYREGENLARDHNAPKLVIDHAVRIASLGANGSRLDAAEAELEVLRVEAERIGYLLGQLDAMCQILRITSMKLEHGQVEKQSQEILEKAQSIRSEAHIAKAYYYLGRCELYKRNPYDALYHLEQALAIQKRLETNYDRVNTLYAMGLVHAELLGLHEKARDFYRQGRQYAESVNQIDGKEQSYLFIAQSYMQQDGYADAQQELLRAIEISEGLGRRNALFPFYVLLARSYTAMSEYDKAFAMLKKAEMDFRKNRYWANYSVQYYYACIEFYLEIRSFDKADQYIHELVDADFYEKGTDKAQLAIFRFILEHYKDNYLIFNKTIDYDFIENRIRNLSGQAECKYLRQAILMLAASFIQHQKYIDVQKLLHLDEKLQDIFTTEQLRAKRAVIEGVLSSDRISYYNKLLYKYENTLIAEDYWLVNKILGDEYNYNGNLYLSINSYFTAFDTVRMLTNRLNYTLRDNYIIFDEAKIDLKKKINGMMMRILEGKMDAERLHFKGIEYNSLEEYFEVGPVRYLYSDKKFMESVYEHYASRYRQRYESIHDLAIGLGSDDRSNIHAILDYCIQRMVAERGFLYILDEGGKVAEVIKSDVNVRVPDVTPLIKSSENGEHGLVVSSLYDAGNRHLLSKNQKALMLIPIRHAILKTADARRKVDTAGTRPSVMGYLYLESTMVFNNFTEDNMASLQSATNLLNVLLDNYNLKRVSTNDRLTGVFLRKYIEEIFPQELNRARAQNLRFSVIMADIDKFKNINDSFGHRKGDEILSIIGRTLKNTLRKNDYVGRYGGEEFVMLLPETGFNDAYLICEKLRKSIEEMVLLGDNRPVTMSFGVAEYPTHGLNEDELMERADQGLYFSKKTGRNRSTVWNESIGQEYLRFDRLAGILSGNISSDTRTVQAIMDIVDLFKSSGSRDEKLLRVMNTLIDITEAQDCAIFMEKDDHEGFDMAYAKLKGHEGWCPDYDFDQSLLCEYAMRESGGYFINWEDTSHTDPVTGIPVWRSCMLIPLKQERMDGTKVRKGVLTLTVPISQKEFDFNTFNFTNSLSGILASML